MKYFALIKNNIVDSIIVADLDFIKNIQPEYSYIIDVTENRPHVGDSYYQETNTFISNTTDFTHITSQYDQLFIAKDFKAINLSKYSAKCENGIVTIGCKQYPAFGLLETLYNLLILDHKVTTHFKAADDGPYHGKFGVSWEDAQTLYDALKAGN